MRNSLVWGDEPSRGHIRLGKMYRVNEIVLECDCTRKRRRSGVSVIHAPPRPAAPMASPELTAEVVGPPGLHLHVGVLAGARVPGHRVTELGLVAPALAQAEEAGAVVGGDVDHAVALQEGAVGGVVDDAAPGTAAVKFQQLRVVATGLQQVPALPVADLLESGPAFQEHRQVVRALATGETELLAGVRVEEATQAPRAVEVGGGEPDVQQTHV